MRCAPLHDHPTPRDTPAPAAAPVVDRAGSLMRAAQPQQCRWP